MARRGLFITFEGGEGVGKSTQIARLATRLGELGRAVVVLREPGSTAIGEQIRSVLLDPANTDLDAHAELLLYEAARAQMVGQIVMPALERGDVVLCDRFNDSTMAYQGVARGLGEGTVAQVDEVACRGIVPDRTILLVNDTAESLERARRAGGADRIEGESVEFHAKVHRAFEDIADRDPARVRRVAMVPGDIDATAEAVFGQVADLFGEGGAR
ncbi:MAG: dTMP kinase [Coriobacteriales bacterium]|jgi:dTMP kinase